MLQPWLTKPMTSSAWKRNSLQLLVWREGFCFKKKMDFCSFLSGQFSPQLLENCVLKGLKSGKEKGSAQQFEPFIFFSHYFLSKDLGGGNSPITPRIQRAQPGVKSNASVMAMADGTKREGALRPRPPDGPRS